MSEHAFLSVICRDTLNKCAVLWIGMLTGGPVQGSHSMCWLKNPAVLLHDSSCKTGVYNTIQYNLHLLIILEREGVAVWIEIKRKQANLSCSIQ